MLSMDFLIFQGCMFSALMITFAPKPKNPLKYLLPDHGKRVHGADLPWPELDKGLSDRRWINLNTSRATVKINDTQIEARGTDDASP